MRRSSSLRGFEWIRGQGMCAIGAKLNAGIANVLQDTADQTSITWPSRAAKQRRNDPRSPIKRFAVSAIAATVGSS